MPILEEEFAPQAYVQEMSSSSGATLVGPFRAIFSGNPESEEYVEPIYVGYDGYLDLNDATLIAQAGNDIIWNTPYPVIENDGYVDENTFGGLRSANPNITVSWYEEEEYGTGEDSAVVFEYTPQDTAPAGGMRMANMGAIQSSNLIQQRSFSQILAQHIKQQETLLADSGQTASDSGFLVAKSGQNLENAVFFRPYLKSINRDEDDGMGYRGELLGMILGYERMLSSELTLGLHGGFGLGYLDYEGTGFDANEENMTIYSLGMHGAYNPGSLHFDGSATLYAANHEYEGLTGGGLEIDEEDDYMSYGAEVEALGGYVFSSGQWAVMPYLGLGYSWINAPSHTTDADDPAWDTHFDSVDEHILRSILGAQVSANWLLGETKVVPTLGLRWEYALTDNDIAVSQSLLGSPSVTVKDDIARSSLISDLSIAFSKNAASLELGAMGQYNEDFTALGGWLTLKYAF
jgi:outer membrane autotransporter protein